MAKKITRWSPDTCDCVIEYAWDDTVPQDERTHTFHKLVRQCDDHAGIEAPQEVHDHVLAENQTKNMLHSAVIAHVPRLAHEDVDANGNKVPVLHPTVDYRWSFSGTGRNRKLVADFHGAAFNANERAALTQAAASFAKPVDLR